MRLRGTQWSFVVYASKRDEISGRYITSHSLSTCYFGSDLAWPSPRLLFWWDLSCESNRVWYVKRRKSATGFPRCGHTKSAQSWNNPRISLWPNIPTVYCHSKNPAILYWIRQNFDSWIAWTHLLAGTGEFSQPWNRTFVRPPICCI